MKKSEFSRRTKTKHLPKKRSWKHKEIRKIQMHQSTHSAIKVSGKKLKRPLLSMIQTGMELYRVRKPRSSLCCGAKRGAWNLKKWILLAHSMTSTRMETMLSANRNCLTTSRTKECCIQNCSYEQRSLNYLKRYFI